MVSSRRLVSWAQLTRGGVPKLKVIRRPLVFNFKAYEVGEVLPEEVTKNRVRMRQFYERRLIFPVDLHLRVKGIDIDTGEIKPLAETIVQVPTLSTLSTDDDLNRDSLESTELTEEDFLIDSDPSSPALPFDLPTISLEEADGDTGTETDSIDPATIPPPPPVYIGANKNKPRPRVSTGKPKVK